jgi:hypothetical protein
MLAHKAVQRSIKSALGEEMDSLMPCRSECQSRCYWHAWPI